MSRASEKQAVIYCRVSSTKQTTRGDGLASQETRCREYAKYRGHSVVKVFKDDMSGSVVGRPGMKDMLAYLRAHRKSQLVVIIDDISRLARGLEAHLRLRADIGSAGGILESPSIEFKEFRQPACRAPARERLTASTSEERRANPQPHALASAERILGFSGSLGLQVWTCAKRRQDARSL